MDTGNGQGDYLEANKKSWDQRAAKHAKSGFYNVEAFKSDSKYISDVIKFDMPRLPSLAGLNIAHLMCHIGTDTLSLARLGAASVTGLDFSEASLEVARTLANATIGSGGEKLKYVEGNVYDAVELLGKHQFDMVFTGIGVLCWIPRLDTWAQAIGELLKPGGKFFLRDHHPVFMTIDEKINEDQPVGCLAITHPYFETGASIVIDDGISYVDISSDGNVPGPSQSPGLHPTYEFSHSLADVVQSLIDAGLKITKFEEHDSVPWNGLPGRMEPCGLQEFRLKEKPERCPFTFTVQAVKE